MSGNTEYLMRTMEYLSCIWCDLIILTRDSARLRTQLKVPKADRISSRKVSNVEKGGWRGFILTATRACDAMGFRMVAGGFR
jgi:hypothetical protein